MRRSAIIIVCVFLLALVGCVEEKGKYPFEPDGGDSGADTLLSFANDIVPILQANCLECHGDPRIRGNYDIRTYEAVMNSGNHAPNIVPFHPESSYAVHVIGEDDTTWHDLSPFDFESVVEPLSRWISQGALDN